MTLDHTDQNPNDLIQYGKEEAVRLMEELARQEADNGDGRALRVLTRLVETAELRKRKDNHTDDGN